MLTTSRCVTLGHVRRCKPLPRAGRGRGRLHHGQDGAAFPLAHHHRQHLHRSRRSRH